MLSTPWENCDISLLYLLQVSFIERTQTSGLQTWVRFHAYQLKLGSPDRFLLSSLGFDFFQLLSSKRVITGLFL